MTVATALSEDIINRIHPRIKDNLKAWFDQTETRSARDTVKLLADLITEGVPFNQVGASLLVISSHPKANVAELIKVSREGRNDPELKPYLDVSKKTLLPPPATTSEEEQKRHKELAGLSRYQSTVLRGVLGTLIGVYKSPIEGIEAEKGKGVTEKQLADDFKSYAGRELTKEERFSF